MGGEAGVVAIARDLLLIFLGIHYLLVTYLVSRSSHSNPLSALDQSAVDIPARGLASSSSGETSSAGSKAVGKPAQDVPLSSSNNKSPISSSNLGAIVLLAPQRSKRAFGHTRVCLLRNALKSIDVHLNSQYGPYDIYILVASDYDLDPERKDGKYTDADRTALSRDLPHSPNVNFIDLPMYSGDALEPNLDRKQFERWYKGLDGGTAGRNIGYRSMCRLWSGRLQRMDFLQKYKYYLRMDDDSLLTAAPTADPFAEMEESHWQYSYRQPFFEAWGYDKMWEIAQKQMTEEQKENMARMGWLVPPVGDKSYQYIGGEPYNNFHIAAVSIWSDPTWLKYLAALEADFGFFKHRMGDANMHAFAMGMLLKPNQIGLQNEFPYVHNINGMPAYGYQVGKCEHQLEKEVRSTTHSLAVGELLGTTGGKVKKNVLRQQKD